MSPLTELWPATQVSIIILAVAFSIFFVLAILFQCVLGYLSYQLLKQIRALVAEQVTPTLDSARLSAASVRGTTTYLSESAVGPVIRTYGMVAGVRRATAVLFGLTGADTSNGPPQMRDES